MQKVLLSLLFLFSFFFSYSQNDFALRINAGGSEVSYSDETFIADTYFDTGSTLDRPQTGLPEPFQSFRYSRSQQMAYSMPIPDGEYLVKLYFAELWFGATAGGPGGVGSRVFDVNIEGQLVEDNLDVFAEVGADAMLVKSHSVTVIGGVLEIDFDSRDAVGGERHPVINAIEILGSAPQDQRPFVTTWKTDNEGDSADNQIEIPTDPNEQYFYNVDWGDGNSDTGITGDVAHTYAQAGTYEVAISGTFPAIRFGSAGIGDRYKIIEINQWGDIIWSTFESAFIACTNMDILATDRPDLSNVSSLNKAFYRCSSISNNGQFTNWDVSTIEDMSQLFSETTFNQDISGWDVSKVTTMYAMFYQTPFNRNISAWNTSSVLSMRQLFYRTPFNQDIGNWDMGQVRNTEQMFSFTPFNQNIGAWDVSSVTDMRSMFQGTPFNQNIGNWDVGNVENIAWMFDRASNFNQDIGSWNTAQVKYSQAMFRDAVSFNQDLSAWDTSNLLIAQQMFGRATSFNQDLGSWNIENVTLMDGMFVGVALSQENYDRILNNWSSQNVQSSVPFDGGNSQYCESQEARQRLIDTMGWIIVDGGRTTDCDIGGPGSDFALRFNTGGDLVEYNGDTFLADNNFGGGGSVLKRPQTGLPEPYQSFRFNRSQGMGYDIPLADGEYTLNLHFAELWFGATGGGSGGVGSRVFDISVEGQLVEDNLDVFAEVGADAMLIKSYTVTVTDGTLDIDFDSRAAVGGERHPVINAIEILGSEPEPIRPFVTTWKTDNPGASESNQITIPTRPDAQYDYSVDWGDGTSNSGVTGNITHSYASPGTYQVSITGDFPRIYFNGNGSAISDSPGDAHKILQVNSWGDIQWQSFSGSFNSCKNLNVVATDTPNLANVESFFAAFASCSSLIGNESFNSWNMGTAKDISYMFFRATSFNQNIGAWDLRNVEEMNDMFHDATSFNQDIGSWRFPKATSINSMFERATNFNGDISDWDVSKIIGIGDLFLHAYAFNQDISNWDVGSVVSMGNAFNEARAFNQDLSNWDVAKVTSMSNMFAGAIAFDQDLGNWDVQNVSSMSRMLNRVKLSKSNYDALLNGWSALPNLKNNVTFDAGISEYCEGETARQNLISGLGWQISDGGKQCNSGLFIESVVLIDALNDQSVYTLHDDMQINAGSLPSRLLNFEVIASESVESVKMELSDKLEVTTSENLAPYTLFGKNGSDYIGNTLENGSYTLTVTPYSEDDLSGVEGTPLVLNFKILDGVPRAFILTFKTDNPGSSDNRTISFRTTPGESAYYDVNWGAGTIYGGVSGNTSFTYQQSGTYTIKITGDFPGIYFENTGDAEKLISVDQWGDIDWESTEGAFLGCKNMDVLATDVPDLSNVTSAARMFSDCSALVGNASFEHWEIKSVQDASNMFSGAVSFNQDIGNWDVGNVVNMSGMFRFAESFNQDIGNWNVGKVEDMSGMFVVASVFNQDIGSWNVSNVTDMWAMFADANNFNQNIGNWNVANVTNMAGMFQFAFEFNQDLSGWNVGNVTNMGQMFNFAQKFNYDISYWNVSKVTSMTDMFYGAWSFNQDIGNWNVSSVTEMFQMFADAKKFDQDLGNWDVSNVTDMDDMFLQIGLSTSNYDKLLDGWSDLTSLQNGVIFGGGNSQYCLGEVARQKLIDDFGWTITDGGKSSECLDATSFITTWKTDNPGISNDNQITIPTFSGETYNYDVDWGDGIITVGETGDATHTYATAGTYQVSITGQFPRIYFNNEGDNDKLLLVEQWGDIAWTSMEEAFEGCTNMDVVASDVPDLSNVFSTKYMFHNCSSLIGNAMFDQWNLSSITTMQSMFDSAAQFNQPIGSWDTSSVTNMNAMFLGAEAFNQPIGNWVTSNVFIIGSIFANAKAFNQPLNNWDISNVSSLNGVFAAATSFNQPLDNWNLANVNDMSNLFVGASSFNQNIGSWDVSNVTNMGGLFASATSFNQDIGNWNVANATTMGGMFSEATAFDQNLENWDVSQVNEMFAIFSSSGLSDENYDKILIGWNQLPVLQSNVQLDAGQNNYCLGEEARQNIIDTYGWTINDAGKSVDCPDPNDFALRINTGGSEIDHMTNTFIADAHFDTGNTLDRPQTGLPEPYQTFRYSRSQQMSYDIPVPDGEYTVNLHFAELWFGATGGGLAGAGRRVFDVSIEGQLVEDNLDIFAEVGAEAMLIKAHTVTVTGGILEIDFDSRDAVGGERHPVINAIEILGSNGGGSGKLALGKKQDDNSMIVYPNQVSDFATVSFEKPTEIQQVYVFDMIGRLVRSYSPNEIKNGKDYTIDVNLYQQGTYFIKMVDNKGASFQKQMLVKRQ